MSEDLLLGVLILVASVLYSSVGQAGGSGYLAVMAFMGVAPTVMRPTALVLNVVVASIATLRFSRAGHLSWSTLWPFLVGSIPLSFVGGLLDLPRAIYNPVVGLILLAAAVLSLAPKRGESEEASGVPLDPPVVPAIASGSAIGLLAGLTGTGGGIFLSPLVLFLGWANPHRMAGLSTAFILANSAAALVGNLAGVRFLPEAIPIWAAAAISGGVVGSGLGSRRFSATTLRRLLAVVLIIAGLKLLLTP